MPRKAKTPEYMQEPAKLPQGKYWLPSDNPWGGFINIRIDEAQKAEFHLWCEANPDEGWRILTDVLGQGMKVTLAYDNENECYILSFLGALVEGSTERYCVTSRTGTLGDVIALAGWKHEVLVAGRYGDLRSTGRMNNWG